MSSSTSQFETGRSDWLEDFSPTTLQLEIADLIFPYLLELARENKVESYQGLVLQIQNDSAEDSEQSRIARSMVPVSMGKPLGILGRFCEESSAPLINTLIVRKGQTDHGSGGLSGAAAEQNVGNMQKAREECWVWDWSEIEQNFPAWRDTVMTAAAQIRSQRKAPGKISKQIAREQLAKYWQDNKDNFDEGGRAFAAKYRETILASLLEGIPVEDAFSLAMQGPEEKERYKQKNLSP